MSLTPRKSTADFSPHNTESRACAGSRVCVVPPGRAPSPPRNPLHPSRTDLGSRRSQVHVRVKIPSKVGGEERELVEQLKQLEGSKAKVGGRGWF